MNVPEQIHKEFFHHQQRIAEALDAGNISAGSPMVVLAGLELFLMSAARMFGQEKVIAICRKIGTFSATSDDMVVTVPKSDMVH